MMARYAAVLADLFFVLLGSAQMALSLRLPNGIGLSAAEPGPGLFPLLVGTLLAIAAAVHLCLNARLALTTSSTATGSVMPIVQLVLSLAAYILLLPRVGFVMSSMLLLLATLSIYGMPGHVRRLATACAITGAAYFVFTRGLGVTMPTATWLL